MNKDKLIVVRGGGDIATGTIYALWNMNYNVVVFETDKPSAIRRNVALSEAVYDGRSKVQDMECVLCHSVDEIQPLWEKHIIPMFCDPECKLLDGLKPDIVIDAILAKKNLGTNMSMAPMTIALGPGFCAGKDVNIVIETMRGHTLATVIEEGWPIPDTATPGAVGGETLKRVMHSPAAGVFKNIHKITDIVNEGDIIAEIITPEGEAVPVYATLTGIIRGLLRDGYVVPKKGFKVADIDPRLKEYDNCFTISDKARCIGGGVLQAIGRLERKMGQ